MSKLYVKVMTKAQLNEWTARAQGWVGDEETDRWGRTLLYWKGQKGGHCGKLYARDYTPATDPAQWAELIEGFGRITKQELHIVESAGAYGVYLCRVGKYSFSDYIWGSSVAIAICRAVIASVFGEYVEVEDE